MPPAGGERLARGTALRGLIIKPTKSGNVMGEVQTFTGGIYSVGGPMPKVECRKDGGFLARRRVEVLEERFCQLLSGLARSG